MPTFAGMTVWVASAGLAIGFCTGGYGGPIASRRGLQRAETGAVVASLGTQSIRSERQNTNGMLKSVYYRRRRIVSRREGCMVGLRNRLGLSARITAALALAAAGPTLLVLVGALWILNGLIDRADQRELRGHYDALQSLLHDEARRAAAMSAVVASIPQVQQAMAEGDRAQLLSLFGDGLEALRAQYGVAQFQFHSPPAIAFLRVHMPAKYGDDLSAFRKTVVQANATDKPVFGLEGGVAGLGIRGVVPIDHKGRHVGTVEFGLSFGNEFFAQFKAMRHVDVSFHLLGPEGFKTYCKYPCRAQFLHCGRLPRWRCGELSRSPRYARCDAGCGPAWSNP